MTLKTNNCLNDYLYGKKDSIGEVNKQIEFYTNTKVPHDVYQYRLITSGIIGPCTN